MPSDIGEVPPGAKSFSHNSNVCGMPTVSMAVSTPCPPVIFMIFSAALLSALLITVVAPKRFATSRRLSSRSIITISAGEKY
jgi:hypothetical protein